MKNAQTTKTATASQKTPDMDEYDPLLAAYNGGDGDQTGKACQKTPTHLDLVHLRQELSTDIKRLQSRLRDCGQRNGEMQGTIATLQGELDHVRNHATALAEALRECADWLSRSTRIDDQEQAQDAREILASWEKAQ